MRHSGAGIPLDLDMLTRASAASISSRRGLFDARSCPSEPGARLLDWDRCRCDGVPARDTWPLPGVAAAAEL